MDKKILITFITAFIWLGCGTLNAQVRVAEEPLAADSLILPEGMQAHELDSLLNDWNVRSHLTADDSCNATGENPQFTEEEYISRLSRLPNVIEMPYNKEVRRYIDQYCERMRRSISIFLGAGNFYIPLFEEALESYQLPLELKYLPIIESALNPKAISRQRATGLWQFMLRTSKSYGLETNSLVEERFDPQKSTWAAVRYLKDLYEIYKDWNLVLAAYNCGPGNVNKAIRRAGGSTDYWELYPFLPKETRGYVPGFIAVNYVMTYYCEHGICPMDSQLPAVSDTVHIHKDLHLKQVAGVCNIDIEQLRSLNPQYKKDLIPGNSRVYALRLPNNMATTFIEREDSIYAYDAKKYLTKRKTVAVSDGSSNTKGAKYHKIKSGETLGGIAARYGVSVKQLRSLNGIKGNNIRAGRSIRVR